MSLESKRLSGILLSSCMDYSGGGINRNRMQNSHHEEDENDLPLSEWVRRIDSVNFVSYDVDGFSTVDDDILTTETLTVEDIVMEVKNQQNSASDEKNLQEEEYSGEKGIEVNVPRINVALQVIRVVLNFVKQHQKMCN